MKPGYVLLELIVAIALGGLIGAGLFTSFFQVNRVYKSVNDRIDIDVRSSLVQHQLERDLSGVFIPFTLQDLKETTTSTTTIVTTEKKSEQTVESKKEKKQKRQPIKKSFFAQNEDGRFSFMAFVTSNPIAVYGRSRPRAVRVMYRLLPEQGRSESSFKLMRSELKKLSFQEPQKKDVQQNDDQEEQGRSYELINGIKSMTVEFIVRPLAKNENGDKDAKKEKESEQKKDAASVTTQEKKVEYKTFRKWGPDEVEQVNRNMPHFVQITIVLWDLPKKREKTFIFKIALFVDDLPPKEIKAAPVKTVSDKAKKGLQKKKEKKFAAAKKTGELKMSKAKQSSRATAVRRAQQLIQTNLRRREQRQLAQTRSSNARTKIAKGRQGNRRRAKV